jgi:predicted MFS family arabinose efflux permease
VTTLTLYGGFASTVFWPIAKVLQDAVGWRWTLAAFALLNLLVCLPVHALILPREAEGATRTGVANAVPPAGRKAALFWLAAAFTTIGLVVGAIGVRLIDLLQAGGLTASQAVWIGTLIGPMQVLGRVVEFTVARRARAVHVGYAAFTLMAVSMAVLLTVGDGVSLAVAAVVLYGMANGVLTIVQGIAPAEIIGGEGVGAMLGRIARPALVARACAPFAASMVLAAAGGGSLVLRWLFVAIAIAAGLCFVMAARAARRL